jgi:hypothetical protein
MPKIVYDIGCLYETICNNHFLKLFFWVFRYGTIVGMEDNDPIMWPGSEWRSIKVK